MSFIVPGPAANAVLQWRAPRWRGDAMAVPAEIVQMQMSYWNASIAGTNFIFNYITLRTADGMVYIYLDMTAPGYFTTGNDFGVVDLLSPYRPDDDYSFTATVQNTGHSMYFEFRPQIYSNMYVARPMTTTTGTAGTSSSAVALTAGFAYRGM